MIEGERKSHYVVGKSFNNFKYNQTIHQVRKHFCRYCLYSVTTAQLLESILMVPLKSIANR